MSKINILIVLDHSNLIEREISMSAEDSPIRIDEIDWDYLPITVVGKDGVLTDISKKSVFKISTAIADTINWTMITIDSNLECTPFLYDIRSESNLDNESNLENRIEVNAIKKYFPNNFSKTKAIHYQSMSNSIVTDVAFLDKEINTSFSFQLLNNENGKSIGFFQWNLNIILSKSKLPEISDE